MLSQRYYYTTTRSRGDSGVLFLKSSARAILCIRTSRGAKKLYAKNGINHSETDGDSFGKIRNSKPTRTRDSEVNDQTGIELWVDVPG